MERISLHDVNLVFSLVIPALSRHPRENRDPESPRTCRIPAFAGMTEKPSHHAPRYSDKYCFLSILQWKRQWRRGLATAARDACSPGILIYFDIGWNLALKMVTTGNISERRGTVDELRARMMQGEW